MEVRLLLANLQIKINDKRELMLRFLRVGYQGRVLDFSIATTLVLQNNAMAATPREPSANFSRTAFYNLNIVDGNSTLVRRCVFHWRSCCSNLVIHK